MRTPSEKITNAACCVLLFCSGLVISYLQHSTGCNYEYGNNVKTYYYVSMFMRTPSEKITNTACCVLLFCSGFVIANLQHSMLSL